MNSKNIIFLIYASGAKRCQAIELKPFATILGRKETTDIVIDSKGISNKHSQIICDNGEVTIEDLGSTNGTFVNNQKIQGAQKILHQDLITIGNQKFVLWDGKYPAPILVNKEQYAIIYEVPFTIGRHVNNHLEIKSSQISNEHALIFEQNKQYICRDLDSMNGTHVDGNRATEHTLHHDAIIKIGNWTANFCCKNMQQENFVISFTNGAYNGQENKITEYTSIGKSEDNDILIDIPSVSRLHCSIFFAFGSLWIKDLNSSNGIKVNGNKVTKAILCHDDQIEIGAQHLVIKNLSAPPQKVVIPVEEITPSATATPEIEKKSNILMHFAGLIAAMVFIFFFFSLLFPNKTTTNTYEQIVDEKSDTENVNESVSVDDETLIAKSKEEASNLGKMYRYDKAVQILQETQKKLSILANIQRLDSDVSSFSLRKQIFDELQIFLPKESSAVRIYIPEEGICNIKNIDSTNHSLILENMESKVFTYLWKKIPPKSFLYLLEQANLHQKYPVVLAEIALEYGFPEECEKYAILGLENTPQDKNKVFEVYAKMLQIPVPKNGFALYKNKLIPYEKKITLEEEERQRNNLEKERLKKEQQELNRIRAIEIAKQREQEEFPLRYTIINEFAKTYSYREAQQQFKELLKQTTIPEFRKQVEKRMEELEPLAKLFEKLIDSINNNTLRNNRFDIGDIQGTIKEATNEFFRIVIPKGELRQRWYYLSPKKVYDFLGRMKTTSEELFFTGVFCFENEMLDEGNTTLINFLAEYPRQRDLVDQYISTKFEVPIPKGGFVAYRGKLISPEERTYLAKGLIRYGSEWVTAADKEKLEQGYVKFNGEWITGDEHELLAKGYVKYKDKWYSRQEINNLRSNWEDAWLLSTPHYDIKSNISEEFINEFGTIIEQAYQQYKVFFEAKDLTRKMTLFAFKGYEDYRQFCIDTGNQNSLRAGGFAHPGMNVGVGWKRQKIEELIQTMIHEGAHLYQFNAYPRTSSPSWLSEAIATQFEGYTWSKANQKLSFDFVSQQRLSWIKRSILNEDYFSVPDLIQGNAGQLINSDAQKAMTFYSQNWSLYYFLTHTDNEKYKSDFRLFLSQVHSGNIRGQEHTYFLKYFSDLENMEVKWSKLITELK